MSEKNEQPGNKTDEHDLEQLLREKEKLESLIKRKFTKRVTVMFTDLTGSTRLSEEIGDLAMRSLLNRHYDIVQPAVEMNAGILVKTMGDGTLSYFEDAGDALRAAIDIQRQMGHFNEESAHLLLVRCGLNTGPAIVEKNDINGDTVNVAQRYEAMASPLEILISQETHTLVKDDASFAILFYKETAIKGKIGPQKVYKVLWVPQEIEAFRSHPPDPSVPFADGPVTTDVPIVGAGGRGQPLNVGGSVSHAELKVVREGHPVKTYDVADKPVTIGRSSAADIQIAEMYISRKHARIVLDEGAFYFEDLGSHVGAMRGGVKVVGRVRMNDGDEFAIGDVRLIFSHPSGVVTTGTSFSEAVDEPTVAFAVGSVMTLALKEQDDVVATYEVNEAPLIIGRQADCDVRLESPMISRKHARIHVERGKAILEDLGSNNGTYVKGERIVTAVLDHCDEFRMGPFALQVVDPTRPAPAGESESSIVRKVFSFLKKG